MTCLASDDVHLERTLRCEAAELIRGLVDPDPCDYDHHGLCQAHSLDERPCPHERAKAWLQELDGEDES